MKNIIFSIALSVITLTACKSNQSAENLHNGMDNMAMPQKGDSLAAASSASESKAIASISEIVHDYLLLKNALAEDNSTGAALKGKLLATAFKSFNKIALTADQTKIFEEINEDACENAEHIGDNGGNIAHQRAHFELLSKNIYDLVRAFGGGQVLYQIFCPMYNSGKGAYWISESREIKNPYFGNEMPTCGTVKEVIK
jgi:hypothetical protein